MSELLPAAGTTASYGVVVPVKRTAIAKSRLAPLGDRVRRDLVTAFAVDTVTAATDCPVVGGLLVVTDDAVLAAGLRELGVEAIPDGESGDLNASLVQGALELGRRWPRLRAVALCADLPALRPDELATALLAAPADRASFVADAGGSGTTLYTAPTAQSFAPHFGAGSRAAHLTAGAMELDLPAIASVRRDVDTPEELREAVELGVGPRTSWVVTRAGLLTVDGR